MRVLFTGGGTGGHITPLVAVAEQVKKAQGRIGTDIQLIYLGAPGTYEATLASAGLKIYKVPGAKLRRYFDVRNFIDLPKFFGALFLAFWKVFWIMPDVLFSKGGPGALPVVIAAHFYRIPIIIHESDTAPGLTNMLSSKYSDRIAISFEQSLNEFISRAKNEKQRQSIISKVALVGNPIRESFFQSSDLTPETVKKTLGFTDVLPLIFVTGGSQGAVRINDFFFSIAGELIKKGYQVLHQVGVNNFASAQKDLQAILSAVPQDYWSRYRIVPFLTSDIKDIYMASDIVVSRSGSASIFEIAAMGKPSILIPLPEAAYNHQVKNAFIYAKTRASIVIEEVNLTPHLFMDQLLKIINDDQLKRSMSEAAKSFARPDAAKMIALEVLKLGSR